MTVSHDSSPADDVLQSDDMLDDMSSMPYVWTIAGNGRRRRCESSHELLSDELLQYWNTEHVNIFSIFSREYDWYIIDMLLKFFHDIDEQLVGYCEGAESVKDTCSRDPAIYY